MAGTTNNRRYPFPGQLDADNVPADIQKLADAVDTDMDTVKATADKTAADLNLQLGGMRVVALASTVYPGANSGGSYVQSQPFGATFSSPPACIVQLATSQAGTGKTIVSAFTATTTGCTLWARTFDGSNLPNDRLAVNLIAIGPA